MTHDKMPATFGKRADRAADVAASAKKDRPDDEPLIDKVTRQFSRHVHDIEQRTDLSREEKIDQIRQIACGACAAIAVQPIPFADIFILTPVQGYFGSRVAAIHRVPVSDAQVLDLVKEVVGLVGLGVVAQQLAIGLWKLVTGGLGGIVTVPLVWTLTYGVMTVVDHYYRAKARGVQLSKEKMREIFEQARKEGKEQHNLATNKRP